MIGRDVSTEGPVLRLLIINCLRAFVATITCWIIILFRGSSLPSLRILASSSNDASKWVLLGLITCIMNNAYTLGLRWTTATNCAIFISTTPLWTYAGALCLGMEVLDRQWAYRALGFFLAIIGAIVVQLGRGQAALHIGQSRFFRLFGNMVVLFAVCSISAYYLLVRSLATRHSPLVITMVAQVSAFLYSLSIIVCLLAAEEASPDTTWIDIVQRLELNEEILYSSLYAGVCINVVCFGIEAWALRYTSPGTVALFTALDPPITCLLSVFFLHEKASATLFVGGFLIICGLIVNSCLEQRVDNRGGDSGIDSCKEFYAINNTMSGYHDVQIKSGFERRGNITLEQNDSESELDEDEESALLGKT